eukprot:UN11683
MYYNTIQTKTSSSLINEQCTMYLQGALNLRLLRWHKTWTQGYVFMKIFAKTC